MQNLVSLEYRAKIIDEILSNENLDRKRESFKRMEIYNKRQAPFVEAKLAQEFEAKTVASMRKITSINISKRITDKMAALYEKSPERVFAGPNEAELSEEQLHYIEEAYDKAKFDTKLKRANRTKKYQNQCVLQVIPARGVIDMRVYHPHQIDCVPMENDPEMPFAFVISSYDRSQSLIGGDGTDQKIADRNDAEKQKRKSMRFVWWSAEHNMITDGYGVIAQEDQTDILNPIKKLPFVDVPDEKENEFWVRKGNTIIDFSQDFAVLLSDTANINRLQGYAQGVLKAETMPADVRVGPENWLFLKLDSSSTIQPSVEFIAPTPNMEASLKLLDQYLSYFMTAEGVDPKSVNSKGDGPKFTSGFERMLAMIESFEASQDDIDLFKWVECEVFNLFCAWSNAYQGTSDSPLLLKGPSLPDGAYVDVKFHAPEMIQAKTEAEDSELKLLDAGLRSKVQALMNIDGIEEAEAIKRLQEAQKHGEMFEAEEPEPEVVPPVVPNPEEQEAA